MFIKSIIRIRITLVIFLMMMCGCGNHVRYVYVENPPKISTDKTVLLKSNHIATIHRSDSILYYYTNESFKSTSDSSVAFSCYVIRVLVTSGLKSVCDIDLNGFGDTVSIWYYDKTGKDSLLLDVSNPDEPYSYDLYKKEQLLHYPVAQDGMVEED